MKMPDSSKQVAVHSFAEIRRLFGPFEMRNQKSAIGSNRSSPQHLREPVSIDYGRHLRVDLGEV